MTSLFISYAHSSEEHKNIVHKLASQLKANGFYPIIDRSMAEIGPGPGGWYTWSKRSMQQSEYWLLYIDKRYSEVFENNRSPGKNYGIAVEIRLIRRELKNHPNRSRIIIIISDSCDKEIIPPELDDFDIYRYPTDYQFLVTRLWNNCTLRCIHCHEKLGWRIEFCPFCGKPQAAPKLPATIQENPKTTPGRPEQSDLLLKPILHFRPFVESTPTSPPRTNPATSAPPPNQPEPEKDTRGHNTAIIVILALLVVALSVTALGNKHDVQEAPQNNRETAPSDTPSHALPFPSSTPPSTITPIIPEMAFIKGGEFEMGSPDKEVGRGQDERLHRVRVDSFYMGKYEVTFDEYDRFAQDTHRPLPRDDGHDRGRRPVFRISWIDAYDYAVWLSAKTGKHYRLPREAEWEYVARLGSTTNKPQTCLVMNHMDCKDSPKRAIRVGSRQPDNLGLYDMFGNVAELTGSAYDAEYEGGELALVTPENGSTRIMRGGSWAHQPSSLRAANRDKTTVDMTHNTLGFRLAHDP